MHPRFVVALALILLTSCRSNHTSAGLEPQSEDYAQARSHFQTKLTRRSPAPQQAEHIIQIGGATRVEYGQGLPLFGWFASPDGAKEKCPAILFLHGGFAFGADDWEMAKPYLQAGFAVMMPILRGENGQPGDFSMFHNEVDDVLAAADFLARQPLVDSKRMYVCGHSVGGTLTLLAAMASNKFRAAASFSGSPDQIAWTRGQEELIPFDPNDKQEFRIRSPIAYATSFKCPVRIMFGDSESLFGGSSRKTAELAKAKGLDVEAIAVPGDHFTALDAEVAKSIEFFKTK